eukprot:1783622-Pyramimonas_sp.AAC.1
MPTPYCLLQPPFALRARMVAPRCSARWMSRAVAACTRSAKGPSVKLKAQLQCPSPRQTLRRC